MPLAGLMQCRAGCARRGEGELVWRWCTVLLEQRADLGLFRGLFEELKALGLGVQARR